MAKTYDSVVDLARDLVDDQFADKLSENILKKNLATTLMNLRCANNLSQADMAKKLKISQPKISKLEHSDIDRISVGDLMNYCRALNLNLTLEFHDRVTLVDHVKYHALEMKKYLERLAKLAQKDASIAKGVRKFFANEVVVNVVNILKGSVDLLPKKQAKRNKHPELEISTPLDLKEQEVESDAVIA